MDNANNSTEYNDDNAIKSMLVKYLHNYSGIETCDWGSLIVDTYTIDGSSCYISYHTIKYNEALYGSSGIADIDKKPLKSYNTHTVSFWVILAHLISPSNF